MSPAQKDPQKAAQKNKRDMIITSILLVIFAFTFTKNVLLRKRTAAAPAAAETVDETQGLADQLIYTTRLRAADKLRDEQRAIWDKEWGRDPFAPQATLSTITKAVNLSLGGIFWDEKGPKAIVNEKTLYKGDTIYGYTVVEIKPKSVILKTGEKTIELSVFHGLSDGGTS